MASTMLGYLYGAAAGPVLSSAQGLGIKIATPVGAFFGQLLFGWLADVVSHKRMCMHSFSLVSIFFFLSHLQMVLSSWLSLLLLLAKLWWCCINYWCLGCLACPCKPTSFSSLLISLHPEMGIGVGGDYPLSAIISSEFASTKIRGCMMTAVFAAQGWGNFSMFYLTPMIIISHSNPLS